MLKLILLDFERCKRHPRFVFVYFQFLFFSRATRELLDSMLPFEHVTFWSYFLDSRFILHRDPKINANNFLLPFFLHNLRLNSNYILRILCNNSDMACEKHRFLHSSLRNQILKWFMRKSRTKDRELKKSTKVRRERNWQKASVRLK